MDYENIAYATPMEICGHIIEQCYAGTGREYVNQVVWLLGCEQKFRNFGNPPADFCPLFLYQTSGTFSPYRAAMCCEDVFAGIANNAEWQSWAPTQICPKGWGKNYKFYKSGPTVSSGTRRAYENEQKPIYGYVTRYRTVYYDYIGSRVAKT